MTRIPSFVRVPVWLFAGILVSHHVLMWQMGGVGS
jgi:hypothetical protein